MSTDTLSSRDRSSRAGRPSRFADNYPMPERDRSPKDNFVLSVSNLPFEFSWQNLKDFFSKAVPDVKYAEVFRGERLGTGAVEFHTKESMERAFTKMKGYVISGRRIHLDIADKYALNYPKESKRFKNEHRPEKNESYEKPNYYGLNKAFLEALHINLPLSNRAFVMNLDYRVDKVKLNDIFRMAGQIHHIETYTNPDGTSKGMAVIEYDHPVEVVQAISMFNGQLLYDRALVVRVDRVPEHKREFRLPEGLEGIGPGLGSGGAPLRNVAASVDKQIADSAKDQDSEEPKGEEFPDRPFINNTFVSTANRPVWNSNPAQISPTANQQMMSQNMGNAPTVPMNNMGVNVQQIPFNPMMNQQNMMQQPLNNMPMGPQNTPSGFMATNVNTMNAGGDNGMGMNAQTLMTLMNLQNQMQQQGLSVTDIPKILASMGGAGNAGGSNQPNDNKQQKMPAKQETDNDFSRMHPDRHRENVSDMVNVSNLPPGVTPHLLHEKFREAGQVKFVDMTGPTSALVRFMSQWDAEQAIKMFHRTRVNGVTIEVNYF